MNVDKFMLSFFMKKTGLYLYLKIMIVSLHAEKTDINF